MSETEPLSVLIVEDDPSLCTSLVSALESASYNVRQAGSALQALEILHTEPFDIILSDLRLPDVEGLSFVAQCRETCPQAALILMTAFGSVECALDAMRAGAYDYISKPFSPDQLILTLRKAAEREKLKAENTALRAAVSQRYNFSNIITKSPAMKRILESVKRLALFNTTVLITGESGTGKELIAQALHHNSPRRGKPFIAINCGAIPENLMESELFGHKRGAFTDATRDKRGLLEEASGGTIFLDEIGEMPLHLQVKILRALQEQHIRRVGDEQNIEIDVRVIAATLRNLEEDVKIGRFRDDLFYRLNVVSFHVPALRERPEDIPVLVQHFMRKHNKRLKLNVNEVSPEAMKCMLGYSWKGNVRELENSIERALVLTESGRIDCDSLPPQVRASMERNSEAQQDNPADDNVLSIKQRTREMEIILIRKALAKTGGNRTRAAKILEISHRALLYKLKEYGIGKENES